MNLSQGILDHEKIIKEISDNIFNTIGYNIVLIDGPSGSGKTWMIQQLSEILVSDGTSIIYLHGDEIRKKEAYYPLSVFIEKRKKIKKTGKDLFYSVLGEVPIVGKPLKTLIESIDTSEIVNQKMLNDIFELKHQLSFSLRLVNLLRKYKNVIVLCENIDSFDLETVTYLMKLDSGLNKLLKSYSLHIIIDSTKLPVQTNPSDFALKRKFEVLLHLPSENQLPSVMAALGVDIDLSSSIRNLIYSCSGGNLTLIKIIADYLIEKGIANHELGNPQIFESIINYRLDGIGNNNSKIESILNSIANVGNQMSRLEVVCLSNNNPEILDILGVAESLEFIYLRENYIQFRHEVIRRAFEARGRARKHEVYSKLAECIKKISPFNYVRRALLEKANENLSQADILWCLVAIEKFRSGLIEEGMQVTNNFSSSLSEKLKTVITKFKECYLLSFEGKVVQALDAIEDIPNYIPLVLQAEKCLLQSENLSKRMDLDSKKTMLSNLSEWNELKEEEPVLWYRIMQLKILAASELHLDEIAKSTEFEIINFYSNRITFDAMAENVLNRLDIYAELIYSPEISHKKLTRVEQKLSRDIEEEEFDRAIDLYIARINLSSNCLLLGMYDKSIVAALAALDLTKQMPNIQFSYPELPLSNMYLAACLGETIELQEALRLYEDLIIKFKNEEDYILLQTNFAGLLLRSGDVKNAYRHLNQITQTLAPDKTDVYYYYYFNFNYALLSYLMGLKKEALDRMRSLDRYVEKAYRKSSSYYRRHYDIVLKLLENDTSNFYTELEKEFAIIQDEYLSGMWNKFKYVYLFTDLQIWTSF